MVCTLLVPVWYINKEGLNIGLTVDTKLLFFVTIFNESETVLTQGRLESFL